MIAIEREVRVDRPPDVVFAVLANSERIPEWQASVAAVTVESDEPLGVGSRWRESRSFLGRRIEQTVAVSEYAAGERLAIEVVEGPVPLRVDHRLRPEDGGTVITVRGEGEPGGALRVGARLLVRAVERQFDQDFARLRAIVEGAGS